MADRFLLRAGQRRPGDKHFVLFGRQLHPIALGEELRKRDAEALADALQRRDGGHGVSAENIGNGRLGKAGFQRKPIFAPLPLVHQFPDALFCIHKDHSLLNTCIVSFS